MKCTICNKETRGWDKKLNRPSCGHCLEASYGAYVANTSTAWPYSGEEPTIMDSLLLMSTEEN